MHRASITGILKDVLALSPAMDRGVAAALAARSRGTSA